ncbi:F-box protein JEMMA and related proteins with JmjC, PHD, F-box and LRR domains [Phaffia rhodozyma]|uniref:[histone H3]-dimethyl-L-lysine(36) demethylase n=1 Tax=Phaffia rhodozyma TaxID=264483 RepID=A0A0F7SL27_PHARH|nr:F-box protein JEMMA and related proteins with JmjC, PHD, F-box and LRR domains [Phaffia rhodozyma]
MDVQEQKTSPKRPINPPRPLVLRSPTQIPSPSPSPSPSTSSSSSGLSSPPSSIGSADHPDSFESYTRHPPVIRASDVLPISPLPTPTFKNETTSALQKRCPSCVHEPSRNSPEGIMICCSNCLEFYHWACITAQHPECLDPSQQVDQHSNKPVTAAPSGTNQSSRTQIDRPERWFCPKASCSSIDTPDRPVLEKASCLDNSYLSPWPFSKPLLRPASQLLPRLSSSDSRPSRPGVSPPETTKRPVPPRSSSWIPRFASFESVGLIHQDGFNTMDPSELGSTWRSFLQGHPPGDVLFERPTVVRAQRELGKQGEESISLIGGRMPKPGLTLFDICQLNGDQTQLEVIDVETAELSSSPPNSTKPWTLLSWRNYFELSPLEKESVGLFNVLSYEVSDSPLGKLVNPPEIVRMLDWANVVWPKIRKTNDQKPRVQVYCLMSPAGCFTNWHVDMAGSSVYYHILRGSKTFYLIEPTVGNLNAYQSWAGAEPTDEWFGHGVDRVRKVTISSGDTLLIPSGWIHAVHTTEDTIAFGGNYLHSYDIGMQFKIKKIEQDLGIQANHTYPQFHKLCWYAANYYCTILRDRTRLSNRSKPGPSPSSTRYNPHSHFLSPSPSHSSSSFSFLDTPNFTPRLLRNLSELASTLLLFIRERLKRHHLGSPAGNGGLDQKTDQSQGGGGEETESIPWFRTPDPFGLILEFAGRIDFQFELEQARGWRSHLANDGSGPEDHRDECKNGEELDLDGRRRRKPEESKIDGSDRPVKAARKGRQTERAESEPARPRRKPGPKSKSKKKPGPEPKMKAEDNPSTGTGSKSVDQDRNEQNLDLAGKDTAGMYFKFKMSGEDAEDVCFTEDSLFFSVKLSEAVRMG